MPVQWPTIVKKKIQFYDRSLKFFLNFAKQWYGFWPVKNTFFIQSQKWELYAKQAEKKSKPWHDWFLSYNGSPFEKCSLEKNTFEDAEIKYIELIELSTYTLECCKLKKNLIFMLNSVIFTGIYVQNAKPKMFFPNFLHLHP